MPKISLHVEADTPEEFRKLMAMFQVAPYWEPATGVTVTDTKDEAPAQDFTPYPDPAPVEEPAQPLTDIQRDIQEGTFGVASADGREEKKARKPRGPNKPKMAPVTEEAPEEVEHVGTVAVQPYAPEVTEQANGADETLTRMDLGDTIAGYVRKYGINFAQTDVSKMLQDMFGADVRKKSDVPDDQKSLRQAIATITQATIDNPYNRKVDVNG